ncbi:MAG: hypothetical protein AVDCRST_MAG05-1102 [uncultured Rubrobacteraceae bacterium]|uniref:Uncharacterized protein n=1 Tax=uncultured Rubrobacteraceae bacterium TaxID=349277 RepID=A0A6J4RVC9_9ACTN|nr:MAG: hypothetical protein AVDCRST_MAG05-1102 [uncultured Rubrobacteraceae bacterium]
MPWPDSIPAPAGLHRKGAKPATSRSNLYRNAITLYRVLTLPANNREVGQRTTVEVWKT